MQLRDREELFAGITRALEQAQTAPCGPDFVEVGPTVLNTRHHDAAVALRHSKPAQPIGVSAQLDRAERPVLTLGEDLRWHSTLTPERRGALQAVLEQLQLPVLATDMARGILPDGHRLSLFLAKDLLLLWVSTDTDRQADDRQTDRQIHIHMYIYMCVYIYIHIYT